MSEHLALIQALAEDRKKITYRPSFAKITGSVLGAILLQQVLYWTEEKGGQFYKFMQPCEHPKYKEGDSWSEELVFTRYELKAAFKAIGTKSTAGVSKKELMSVKEPDFDEKGVLKNATNLVIYWTDSSRITWFWLNTELLGKAVSQHYLGKSTKQNYLEKSQDNITYKMPDYNITSSSEITSKTTAESNTPIPPAPIPDIQKQADEVIAKVPPKNINDEQASVLLLSSYLDATQSVDTDMLRNNDRKSEALRLIDKGITGEHIAAFVKRNKSENGYWHGQNVAWKILIKDIVSHFEIRPLYSTAKPALVPIQSQPELTDDERKQLAEARKTMRPAWEKVGVQ